MRQRQPVVLSQEELEQHNDGFFKAMPCLQKLILSISRTIRTIITHLLHTHYTINGRAWLVGGVPDRKCSQLNSIIIICSP